MKIITVPRPSCKTVVGTLALAFCFTTMEVAAPDVSPLRGPNTAEAHPRKAQPRRASRSTSSRSRAHARVQAAIRDGRVHADGVATPALLHELGACESGNDPRRVSKGGLYWGAFQFLLSTWRRVGMRGNPIDHTYKEQSDAAGRISVYAWYSQFPSCARQLGVA